MTEYTAQDHSPEGNEQIRDRAARLFTFLREITELRTKNIHTTDQYDSVLWFDTIPREPGCFCISWKSSQGLENSDLWLEIKKPRLKNPPKPHVQLEPWLDPKEVEDSSREWPDLRERICITDPLAKHENSQDEKTILKERSECPEIQPLWDRYIQNEWRQWADEDRRLKAVQQVYTDLFSIYQKQQRMGEAYEVVLGLGHLVWRTPSGYEVKRHIITAQTSLSFDAAHGLISLGPAGEGAKPTLEQDMLDPQERPAPAALNAIEQQVEAVGDALWDGVQINTVLKAWVHEASPQGQFDECLAPLRRETSDPHIQLAPAVILRKRTDRSLLRMFQDIIQQIREGKPIPVGVQRLVSIMEDSAVSTNDEHAGPSEEKVSSIPQTTGEIYFPLPANEEQREIAARLSSHHGVLVQGPPGTGKSHTIANLVCHLLATGQRVLITSHTSRALNALLERFRTDDNLKEIADLCVILLSDNSLAMQALEDSVQGISDRHNNWDSQRNQRKIAELERKLEAVRKEEALTLNEMRTIREAEVYQHPPRFGDYSGTAQSIARRLEQESFLYAWFSKEAGEEQNPPLSDIEAVELLGLLRQINADQEQELSKIILDVDSLSSPTEFALLVTNEAEAIAKFDASASVRAHPSYSPLSASIPEIRNSLLAKLSDIIKTFDSLSQSIYAWAKEAAVHILADRDRVWRELLNFTKDVLTSIEGPARHVSRYQIAGLENRKLPEVKAHSEALLGHLEQGGGLGFGPFRPRVVKSSLYIIKEVVIDGNHCKKEHLVRDLVKWLTVADHLDVLRARWSLHVQPSQGAFSTQVEEYKDLCEPLEKALELHKKVVDLKEIIASINGLQEPTWHNPEALNVLEAVAKSVSLEEELKAVQRKLEILEKHLFSGVLDPNSHPAIRQALDAVRSRNVDGYLEAYRLLASLKKASIELKRRRSLFQRLERACPNLVLDLSRSFQDSIWDQQLREFTRAWNWSLADQWLKQSNDPQVHQQLANALEQHRKRISELLRDVAAAKAWGHCFARLKEHERQHLMAWKDAIRRVGRGTGRHAPMHRKAAREHMEQCRSAIPAWIMPIYRVAETIRPGKESFDVVIVDEASQSGPEASFLQYLAKKIVVVGDDKQISPDFVGTMRDDVELLRQRHILDIPLSDSFGLDTSFFGQAAIRFPGRIRLREHFRCMPEIIQFSNNLCYRSEPLIPLRQYGAGRLKPIETRHIASGYQKGESPKIVNPPEAEALVSQIVKCCDDPTYAEKSMGVISLLGEEQSKTIERLLLKTIGPEEIEKRNIVCGNAYAFQGTERDIMFLSLVSAPTSTGRVGTLASPADERRFNVAASRARDQMWLFHTATINDLSSNCLRYRFLEYCLNPSVGSETVGNLHLDELRKIAKNADRTRVPAPSPFDSWFEVDVCLMIMGKGYRVLPQFAIGGRRIDLMIEGIRGRLAVECDGDAWHGIEQYDEDTFRERILARCGLTFWRVRGSAFYRDPERATEDLWEKLNSLEIYPAYSHIISNVPQSLGNQASSNRGSSLLIQELPMHEESKVGKLFYPPEPLFDEDRDASPGNTENDSRADIFDNNGEPRDVFGSGSDEQASFLTPYQKWTAKPLPTPDSVPLDDVVRGLVEIISFEGPMPCHRAYHLYAKAAGIGRVGRQIRSIFNRGIRKAVRLGLIEERNEHQTRDQLNQIVRKASSPAVVLRSRGDRTFDEIPPAEIRAMIVQLRALDPHLEEEQLLRSTLDHFGIRRMTSNIHNVLLHQLNSGNLSSDSSPAPS